MTNLIEMTKNKDGVYTCEDYNPYSEYVHPTEEAESEPKQDAVQRQKVITNDATAREQAMKNLDEFMVGVDTVMHAAEEFMKRFHRFRKM